jgi:radical SAM protein with 4Fe4S-binding SPASM domain
MRERERWTSLLRSPHIVWNLLLRGRYGFSFDLMPVELTHMSWAQRLNLLRYALNLLYRRSRPWSLPLHMQVELTNFCNLRCPVCPAGTRTLGRSPEAIDTRLFERLLEEVGPTLLTLALFAWGEPLLHPRLGKVLEAAGKYNVATLLSTNGQNLADEAVVEALLRYPVTYLIVAIDGLTDETNARFRVGARLAPILEGVRALAKGRRDAGSAFPVLHMRYLVMKHNQHEVESVKAFAEENSFDLLSIRTLSPIDQPGTPYLDFLPDQQEFRAHRYDRDRRVKRNDFVCMHGVSYPTVFSNGTVVSCEQDFRGQQPYGVLSQETTFKDIWFGKRASEIRRTIRDNPSCYSFCLNCPFADRPVSACSIQAYDLRNTEGRG